jgi:RimJ/RimL family protein N-acetyltransferase
MIGARPPGSGVDLEDAHGMPAHVDFDPVPLPEELCSERLVLRPYRPADAAVLFAAVDESRERLRRWLDWVDEFETPDHARFYVSGAMHDWRRRRDLFFGVFDRDGRYLGNAGLHNIDWSLRSFEIGYWLRDGAEGHGYAQEAVRRLTRFAFEDLAANRVEIRCDPRNERSRRVAERSGFVYEGCLRTSRRDPDGKPRDTVVYAVVPGDETDGQTEESR